ncbi:MAG: hypothetical protein IJH79_07095 [Lentisphaeria bacterium]|nr:hypothetical protein [Lentisphaeria bacterium]
MKNPPHDPKPRITVSAYPPSKIPEVYYPTRRINRRVCLLCIHYTAQRDLRRDKRYIVPLEHGDCALKQEVRTCGCYERIPELRAANMNPAERVYHHMYTRKYLQKVLRWFFHAPELFFDASKNHRFAEEWADMIIAYEKNTKGQTEK